MNPERPSHTIWSEINFEIVNEVLNQNKETAHNLALTRLQGLRGMLQEVEDARDQVKKQMEVDARINTSTEPFADWDKEVEALENELREWKEFMETKGWSPDSK